MREKETEVIHIILMMMLKIEQTETEEGMMLLCKYSERDPFIAC